MRYDILESPLGELLVAADDAGLRKLSFLAGSGACVPGKTWQRARGAFAGLAGELEAYFSGEPVSFSAPVAGDGTAFQRRVWRALCDIPHGTVASYGDIARAIGSPGSVRAVGAANGANPIAIVVPCHRVIGSDGGLTGYAGGLDIKRQLLAIEGIEVDGRDRVNDGVGQVSLPLR